MIDVKNIKEVFVAKDCDRTATVQITDPGAPTTYFGNGEMVITDPQGNVLTTTTAIKAVDRIFVHTRSLSGSDTYRSVEIPGSAITGFFCENYTVSNEQVSTIGYNGVAGNFGVNLAADTLYWVKVISKWNPHCRNVETFGYKSGNVTPTLGDVVLGIASKINLKGGTQGYDETLKIKATVLTDAAPVAIAATGKVTRGSKYVQLSADVATLEAGDAITIATVPYQVDRVVSLRSIKLSSPYQGDSDTAAALAKVPKDSGNWGMAIEGLEYEFEAGQYNYKMCSFELTPSEDIVSQFVTTPSFRGKGTYKQVAELEWYCKNFQGNDAKVDAMGARPINYKYDTPLSVDGTAETFDLVTITWQNTETKTVSGNTTQEGSVVLALPVGAGQVSGGTDTIAEVLNKYIVTEWGVGTAITLS